MRTLSIVGARPQFIKLAPVSRAMRACKTCSIDDYILHTGQHYDPEMSSVFFDELEIPKPAADLAVGSGSHGVQTARMLELIEAEIQARQPDMVITYGDTNSTVAGALAAAKLHVPLAHIEAGLRSFDRLMPEEVNRIVTDHLSELLFAPTETAVANLRKENLGQRTILCGDVMLDAIIHNEKLALGKSTILDHHSLADKSYAVATLHRPVNTDSDRLPELLAALNEVATNSCEIVFPIHPRTINRIKTGLPRWKPCDRLHLVEPIGYLDMLRLLGSARLALTDSGGLQKEAFFLGTPCVTLRDETEWTETVEAGANVLVGGDAGKMISVARQWLQDDFDRLTIRQAAFDMFGKGEAAADIVEHIGAFGTGSPSNMGTAS